MAGTRIDKHGKRWRVRVISGGATRHTLYRDSREAAERVRDEIRAEFLGLAVEQTIEEYGQWLTERGHRGRPSSTQHAYRTANRLKGIYRTAMMRPPGWLTATRCGRLYEEYRTSNTKKNKHPSATEQLNTLSQAKTHGRWLVRQGYTKANPWEKVEPIGQRKRGREQLTVDESRKFVAACLQAGSPESVVALLMLFCGLRVGEVLAMTGRDLDDSGRVLIVRKGKTASAARRVQLGILSPHVVACAEGVGPAERIWTHDVHAQLRATRALCKAAGVTVVDNHGLRGTCSSLAVQGGGLVHNVSAALGHAGQSITLQHYIRPAALADARAGRAAEIIGEVVGE